MKYFRLYITATLSFIRSKVTCYQRIFIVALQSTMLRSDAPPFQFPFFYFDFHFGLHRFLFVSDCQNQQLTCVMTSSQIEWYKQFLSFLFVFKQTIPTLSISEPRYRENKRDCGMFNASAWRSFSRGVSRVEIYVTLPGCIAWAAKKVDLYYSVVFLGTIAIYRPSLR